MLFLRALRSLRSATSLHSGAGRDKTLPPGRMRVPLRLQLLVVALDGVHVDRLVQRHPQALIEATPALHVGQEDRYCVPDGFRGDLLGDHEHPMSSHPRCRRGVLARRRRRIVVCT